MIRRSDIGWSAIKADKHLNDLSIITEKLADLCVTTEKINDLGVITEKINDLAVTTAKLADLAVTNAKIDDATIAAAKLVADCVKIVEEFSLIAGVQEVAATGTGTFAFPHSVNILRNETIENAKAVEAIMDFTWAATADGTLQIYDETNNIVLAETTGLTGGEVDDGLILSIAVADLRAGARIICRAHVTGAGATDEVSKIHRCFIKVIKGYS